jgi:hypothetical protein
MTRTADAKTAWRRFRMTKFPRWLGPKTRTFKQVGLVVFSENSRYDDNIGQASDADEKIWLRSACAVLKRPLCKIAGGHCTIVHHPKPCLVMSLRCRSEHCAGAAPGRQPQILCTTCCSVLTCGDFRKKPELICPDPTEKMMEVLFLKSVRENEKVPNATSRTKW